MKKTVAELQAAIASPNRQIKSEELQIAIAKTNEQIKRVELQTGLEETNAQIKRVEAETVTLVTANEKVASVQSRTPHIHPGYLGPVYSRK